MLWCHQTAFLLLHSNTQHVHFKAQRRGNFPGSLMPLNVKVSLPKKESLVISMMSSGSLVCFCLFFHPEDKILPKGSMPRRVCMIWLSKKKHFYSWSFLKIIQDPMPYFIISFHTTPEEQVFIYCSWGSTFSRTQSKRLPQGPLKPPSPPLCHG